MNATVFMASSEASSPTVKGARLFRAISRKLARRCNDEEDGSSSGSESSKKEEHLLSADSGFRSLSPNHMSSSSSEAGSEIARPRHQFSTSAESIRRVFQNLSLNARSQSCNNTKEASRKNSKKSAPKRILRSPVTYTYVRGLSGLPTQRVPKHQARMYMQNPAGLHR